MLQLRRRGDGRDGYRRGSGLLCGRCRRDLSGSGRRGSGIGDGRRGVEAGRTGISRHGLRLGRLCGFRRRRTRTGDGRVGPIFFRLVRFGLILFLRLFLDSLGLSFFDGKGVLFDFGLCLGLRIGCDFLGGLFDRFGNRLGFLGLGRLDRCGRRNRLGLLGGLCNLRPCLFRRNNRHRRLARDILFHILLPAIPARLDGLFKLFRRGRI